MNVLLAVDESTCSQAAVAAVRERFAPAATVVRVVHVVEWPRELTPSLAFAEGPDAAAHVLAAHARIRQEAQALAERAARELQQAQFKATAVVIEGQEVTVRNAILDMAAEWPADTIVLGSHGRTGLDRLLFGSVSDGVLRHAQCAVEIVRAPPAPDNGGLPVAS
jgi:nucleotide-binding universal stress UspA family protein